MVSTSSTRTLDQILAEADSRISESTDLGYKRILDQFETDGTYLSRDMLQLLVYVMYGPDAQVPGNPSVYHYVDATYALTGLFEPVSLLYRQTEFLVKYLEDPSQGNGGQLIEGFILAIRRTKGVWETVLPRDEFKRAWRLMSLSVHFSPITPSHGIRTFRDYFDTTFPRPDTINDLPGFDITLSDILAVDIKLLTTDLMDEHLTMDGDTLKILVVSSINVWGLRHYHGNRAARALGISSLGEEILYTCHVLYGKDQLFQQATALGLLKLDTEITKSWGPRVLALAQAKPFVLSERARKLQREINRRRAWLPSLMRDIKRQAKSQPFLFYGGVLAVFFGILQSIQTITSIWSLVLSIQAQKAPGT